MAGKVQTSVATNATGQLSTAARLPAVAREQMGTRQGNALQQHAADATSAARSDPRTQGTVTLKAVAFASTATVQLNHRLGRAYVGWHAHSTKGAPATLYETTTPDATKFLVLVNGSSSAFTTDLDVW